MNKKLMSCLWVMGAVMTFCGLSLAEEVQITTYYPSPVGNYQKITATDDVNLATLGGNVMIGSGTAAHKLDVNGDVRVNNKVISRGAMTLEGTGGVTIDSTNDALALNAGSGAITMTTTGNARIGADKTTIGAVLGGGLATLNVNGSIRITGGGPVAGEALVATDNNGNANWQRPTAVYAA